MEFKNTLEIVTKDIQDIEKLVSNFKNYSRIPNIELDLALSRLRNVYDLLLMFRDDAHADIHEHAQPIKEEFLHAPGVKDIPVSVPVPVVADKSGEISSPFIETEIAASLATVEPEIEQVIETREAVTQFPVAPQKSNIKKKPEDKKIYIHERLGDQSNKKDISSKLQNQAIKSISGSLGINDKFLFIRELFAGNAETFRQTLEELDNARNFNDAYSLLTGKFQWDMDSEPAQMLLNLVRRKFIPSGNE